MPTPLRVHSVSTHADGFGRWYATLAVCPGLCPEAMSTHLNRLKSRAARAIHEEIAVRQGPTPPPVRVTFLAELSTRTELVFREGENQSPENTESEEEMTSCLH